MKPEHNKLSVSMAATTAQVFFKEMAQDKKEYQPRLLTSNTILHYALTRENWSVCCLYFRSMVFKSKVSAILSITNKTPSNYMKRHTSSSVNSSLSTSSSTCRRFSGASVSLGTSSSSNTSFS